MLTSKSRPLGRGFIFTGAAALPDARAEKPRRGDYGSEETSREPGTSLKYRGAKTGTCGRYTHQCHTRTHSKPVVPSGCGHGHGAGGRPHGRSGSDVADQGEGYSRRASEAGSRWGRIGKAESEKACASKPTGASGKGKVRQRAQSEEGRLGARDLTSMLFTVRRCGTRVQGRCPMAKGGLKPQDSPAHS